MIKKEFIDRCAKYCKNKKGAKVLHAESVRKLNDIIFIFFYQYTLYFPKILFCLVKLFVISQIFFIQILFGHNGK